MPRLYFHQFVVLFCLVSLALAFPGPAEDEQIQRDDRDFLGLCLVMSTYTGQVCLDYLGYGCYCGIGGSGQPVDNVDECCRQHDNCYGKYVCDNTYFIKNQYDCKNKSCTCKDPPSSGCPYNLCQCDVAFGECLTKVKINKTFAYYDKRQCGKVQ